MRVSKNKIAVQKIRRDNILRDFTNLMDPLSSLDPLVPYDPLGPIDLLGPMGPIGSIGLSRSVGPLDARGHTAPRPLNPTGLLGQFVPLV